MKKTIIVLASVMTIATIGFSPSAFAHAATTSTTPMAQVAKSKNKHLRIHVRLDQAVRDGVITEAQKTAFIAEMKNLNTERTATIYRSSTTDQRQAERAKLSTELLSWARTNNFPIAKIMPKLGSNGSGN